MCSIVRKSFQGTGERTTVGNASIPPWTTSTNVCFRAADESCTGSVCKFSAAQRCNPFASGRFRINIDSDKGHSDL